MVEKFTIADGRQREGGGGPPMIERVEWADRKITGYAEERQTEEANGHQKKRTLRTRARAGGECGVHIMAREVTKEIGPPFSEVVKVVRRDV